MSKHNRYSLSINPNHMSSLLDALINYQVEVERDGTEEQKFIANDLVRRATLLQDLAENGEKFYESRRSYLTYCKYGDRPSDNQ